MRDKFRPSHAIFFFVFFGIRDHRGGGRSSARETIGRVAAGAIAKKVLRLAGGLEIRAFVTRIQDLEMAPLDHFPTLEEVEASPVRCPDGLAAARMIERIKAVRAEGDSVGGLIECRIRGVPAGLGEPVFDRLEAEPSQGDALPPRHEGIRAGQRLCRNVAQGFLTQRPLRKSRRPGAHADQPQRRVGGISNGEEILPFGPRGV